MPCITPYLLYLEPLLPQHADAPVSFVAGKDRNAVSILYWL